MVIDLGNAKSFVTFWGSETEYNTVGVGSYYRKGKKKPRLKRHRSGEYGGQCDWEINNKKKKKIESGEKVEIVPRRKREARRRDGDKRSRRVHASMYTGPKIHRKKDIEIYRIDTLCRRARVQRVRYNYCFDRRSAASLRICSEHPRRLHSLCKAILSGMGTGGGIIAHAVHFDRYSEKTDKNRSR